MSSSFDIYSNDSPIQNINSNNTQEMSTFVAETNNGLDTTISNPDITSNTIEIEASNVSFYQRNIFYILLILFAIVGIIYVSYLFRDIINAAIEEILIYFGLMKSPEKEEPEMKPKKKGEKGKYCVVGKNQEGKVICVPFTNHRDCNSNDFVLESDCDNI